MNTAPRGQHGPQFHGKVDRRHIGGPDGDRYTSGLSRVVPRRLNWGCDRNFILRPFVDLCRGGFNGLSASVCEPIMSTVLDMRREVEKLPEPRL